MSSLALVSGIALFVAGMIVIVASWGAYAPHTKEDPMLRMARATYLAVIGFGLMWTPIWLAILWS